jgi:RimJ/RimL family protein N-acetyltransferase
VSLPKSNRLVFRHWTSDDLPLAESLWGDAEVTRFFGGPLRGDEVRARLEVELERQRRYGHQYWPMFLSATGEFAGCAGLRPWHDEPDMREAGVHLMRSMWGKRLGEEAVRAVIAHGFDVLDLRAIVAGHGQGHTNSRAMMERVGFRYTHDELWGPKQLVCSFYVVEPESFRASSSA